MTLTSRVSVCLGNYADIALHLTSSQCVTQEFTPTCPSGRVTPNFTFRDKNYLAQNAYAIIHFNNHCFILNFNLSIQTNKLKINLFGSRFTGNGRADEC